MKKRYWIAFGIAGIMIIVMSAYHFWVRPGRGDVAPSFVLSDIENRTVSLDEFRGKVVLLHFWAPWCNACLSELPVIEKLSGEFKDKGLVVVSVLVEEREPQKSIKYIRQIIPLNFPVLVDREGRVADAYEVWGVPESFIIGRDGLIIARFSSVIDEKEVRQHLESLL